MDPSSLSCPNLTCPDKGVSGAGNVRIHSRAEARYRCRTCTRTFAATTNTPLYRLHHPEATLMLVLTLLLHGCPSAAIVAAFGVDERTVRAWLHKAGAHAALLHDQLIGAAGVEARQVQADEIRVRVRGGGGLGGGRPRRGQPLLAGHRRRAPPRRPARASPAAPCARRAGQSSRPARRGRVRRLRHGGAGAGARAGAPRPAGATAPGLARGLRAGPGDQGGPPAGRGDRAARRRGDRGESGGRAGGEPGRGVHHHRLQRAAHRHAARTPGPARPPPHARPRRGRDRGRAPPAASGLQLVLGAREPAPARQRHGPSLSGADPRHGGGLGRPALHPRRDVAPACPSGPTHGTSPTPSWSSPGARTPRPIPTTGSATLTVCRMTTVPWGCTPTTQSFHIGQSRTLRTKLPGFSCHTLTGPSGKSTRVFWTPMITVDERDTGGTTPI